jgi:FixJ family two-component response regulator
MISIIDDDEWVREATMCLVRSLGYPVAAFASAEAYLRSDSMRDTSCLIIDVQMPGMKGPDLQDRLIADGHRTPMIFMTALPTEKLRTRVFEAGAFGFLSKPFDAEALIGCLDKALASDDAATATVPRSHLSGRRQGSE